MIKEYLVEDSRSDLINRSKSGKEYSKSNQAFGKNRYERRTKSKVSSSVSKYNKIDMNRLFKDNILDVDIEVIGETDTYDVKISFTGFLDELHKQLDNAKDSKIDLRIVSKSLMSAFNSDNVYIHCTCPDWKYRMAYWATKNAINSGEFETRKNQYERTNNDDSMGPGCKHSLLCLSNNSWLMKVASVIKNYINYIKEHYEKLYADVLYPAIYEQEYQGDVQEDTLSGKYITIYDFTTNKTLFSGYEEDKDYAKYKNLKWYYESFNDTYVTSMFMDDVVYDENNKPVIDKATGKPKTEKVKHRLVMKKSDSDSTQEIIKSANAFASSRNNYGRDAKGRFVKKPKPEAINEPDDKQINFDDLL